MTSIALLRSMNSAVEPDRRLKEDRLVKSVKRSWPELKAKADQIAKAVAPSDAAKVKRSDGQILVEVLETVRAQGNRFSARRNRCRGLR